MQNFECSIPTKVAFGRGKLHKLKEVLPQYGKRVLFLYGMGSIKKTKLFEEVKSLLTESGYEFWELDGITPNPDISKVDEGIALCREHQIQVLLPVGGGSVIDCAKGIAAARFYDGPAWDIVKNSEKIKKTLPIIAVLTIAGTGSEMDAGAVISNAATEEKCLLTHPDLAPVYSILDPVYTYTVPASQTAAGAADTFSHVLETYFNDTGDTFMQDRIMEALMKTCIRYGPIAVAEPDNYDARANLMWASAWALNGFISCGKFAPWTIHPIEHQLSACYGITHGVGLAILIPVWMRYILNDKTMKLFVDYGTHVWDIPPMQNEYEIAKQSIDKTEAFFQELGMPKRLSELGITEKRFNEMAERACLENLELAYVPFEKKDVIAIYKAAL